MSTERPGSPLALQAFSALPSARAPNLVAVVEGKGLHSGLPCRVRLQVAPAGSGLVFRYFSEEIEYSSPAQWLRVSGTSRATALVMRGTSRRRFQLSTVEHFLAAAHILSVNDLFIDVEPLDALEGDILEIPILDGSAAGWLEALSPFARGDLPSEGLPAWKVIRPLEIRDENRRILLSPLDADPLNLLSRYVCHVRFGVTLEQSCDFEMDWARPSRGRERFVREVAPARTFGFRAELEALARRGLAKGAGLSNAILLDGDQVVNSGGFRVPQELAAHKLLDAIGDFYLLGAPLLGRVDLFEAGHSMHLRALEEAVRTGAIAKGLMTPLGFRR